MIDEEALYPSFVVGVRQWLVDENGNLSSLFEHCGSGGIWPAKKPFKADCNFLRLKKGFMEMRKAGKAPPPLVCATGSLASLASSTVYIFNHSDTIPDLGCDCGIYALKFDGPPPDMKHANACGRVALWGRVIEHEHGFRAEYAYPLEVTCLDQKIAKRVAVRYGVPVKIPDTPGYRLTQRWKRLIWRIFYGSNPKK